MNLILFTLQAAAGFRLRSEICLIYAWWKVFRGLPFTMCYCKMWHQHLKSCWSIDARLKVLSHTVCRQNVTGAMY